MQEALTTLPTASATDREWLERWRGAPGAENLRPLVERYISFVYSSAYRRAGNAESAAEVTRAVFLVLARRGRKLRKNTVLADWLFHVTAVACRKLPRKPQRARWRRSFVLRRRREVPTETAFWARVAPEIDSAISRLPASQRNAVLL